MSYTNLTVEHYESIRRLLVESGYPTLPPYEHYDDIFDYAFKDFVLRLYGERLHNFPVRMAELPRAFVEAFGEDPGVSQFTHSEQRGFAQEAIDLLPARLAKHYAEVTGVVAVLETEADAEIEHVEEEVSPPEDEGGPAEVTEEQEQVAEKAEEAVEEQSGVSDGAADEFAAQDPVTPPVQEEAKPAAKVKLKTKR